MGKSLVRVMFSRPDGRGSGQDLLPITA